VDGHTQSQKYLLTLRYDTGIILWNVMRSECIIQGVGNDSEACCGWVQVGGCARVMCSSGYGNFAKEGGTK